MKESRRNLYKKYVRISDKNPRNIHGGNPGDTSYSNLTGKSKQNRFINSRNNPGTNPYKNTEIHPGFPEGIKDHSGGISRTWGRIPEEVLGASPERSMLTGIWETILSDITGDIL